MKMNKQPQNAALIVVDVQNGFTPSGNLAVADADTIIPTINQLADCFENVVLLFRVFDHSLQAYRSGGNSEK